MPRRNPSHTRWLIRTINTRKKHRELSNFGHVLLSRWVFFCDSPASSSSSPSSSSSFLFIIINFSRCNLKTFVQCSLALADWLDISMVGRCFSCCCRSLCLRCSSKINKFCFFIFGWPAHIVCSLCHAKPVFIHWCRVPKSTFLCRHSLHGYKNKYTHTHAGRLSWVCASVCTWMRVDRPIEQ